MTTIDESYIPDIDYGDYEGEGSGRRAIFIILVALLILAIGALAYWRLAVYKPGRQTLQAIEKTTAVKDLGAQTMNLSDGSLIQVGVVLRLTTVADPKEIEQYSSALANAEIFTFGSMTVQQALSNQGRTQAQQWLTTRFNNIVGPVNKLPQIQGIYFNSYQVSSSGAPVG